MTNAGTGYGMFDFDSSTGASSHLTTSPSPYGSWASVSGIIRSDPSGKFVYSLGCAVWPGMANGKCGMIGFAIGSNGSLSIVPGAPDYDPGVQACGEVDGIAVTP